MMSSYSIVILHCIFTKSIEFCSIFSRSTEAPPARIFSSFAFKTARTSSSSASLSMQPLAYHGPSGRIRGRPGGETGVASACETGNADLLDGRPILYLPLLFPPIGCLTLLLCGFELKQFVAVGKDDRGKAHAKIPLQVKHLLEIQLSSAELLLDDRSNLGGWH